MHIRSDPDRTEVEHPNPSGAREQSALPFRLLLVSDLQPQNEGPDDWSKGTHLHRVNKITFADFMAEMAPQLSVEVENELGEFATTWEVDLSFPELASFEPTEIAQQMRPTARLIEIRDLLEDVRSGAITLDTFQSRLDGMGVERQWIDDFCSFVLEEGDMSPSKQEDGGEEDDSLDRVMNLVDVEPHDAGASPPKRSASSPENGWATNGVAALVDAVRADDSGHAADASALENILDTLTAAIRNQVRSVLQHPEMRQLEGAWRGLKFVVDRLNFREDVELLVLPAGREDLHEALYHQVLVPEHSDEHEEPPISLILVDQAFHGTHADVEQLSDLAGTGQSLQTPVVTSVHPEFFGTEEISDLRTLPALRPHLQGDEYVEWTRLRTEEKTQFLGLTVPSFLLRRPYDSLREGASSGIQQSDGLWGGGALAVGVAAAQSFVETGWPTHLKDVTLEGMPVSAGSAGMSSVEVLLPGHKQSELARAGFIVLGGKANRNTVRVTHAPMVHATGTFESTEAADETRAKRSLPCRLFVARVAHRLYKLKQKLDRDTPPSVLRDEVAARMRVFLDIPPSGEETGDYEEEPDKGDCPSREAGDGDSQPKPVHVDYLADVDLPKQEVLVVRLRPPDPILAPAVRIAVALRISQGGRAESR